VRESRQLNAGRGKLIERLPQRLLVQAHGRSSFEKSIPMVCCRLMSVSVVLSI
jgi:hypothetical protein